ncbi:glycosyltransferase involved in cell wall biosynthesis [Flavobacterium nitrogenifigens]|uniref:Glycosyltransferase involved in cell wall biosynthesis n=2 Tax=Flavobacterium TaxID=237 RepID=A0A7W7IZP9_9FLAO|nr:MULTISPECIES: glycosyltransferase [Flavobacterium]MBB4803564.1 glycosyltransferase involved in cell wall biosynthesis [Flavobacterium nitrogenifigens]MBB6388631.1 glycosyltransferase involved in cell wall biosynthesis [Flavobacterium notoginsengisoli]
MKRKILFLGESYRADAITWMKGLKEFGDFEIITWELQTPNNQRFKRILEYLFSPFAIQKIIKREKPDMVIAERTTSYGFLAALSGAKTIAIAQQGRTDLWPEESVLYPFKKFIQKYAFKKAHLIHAWGPVMAIHMKAVGVDMNKVLILPKGIDLSIFTPSTNNSPKIEAIVTRSLMPEYRHESILKAFGVLHQTQIDFSLTIVGDGPRLQHLKDLAKDLQMEKKVLFTGRIPNTELPKLLQQSNIYISMPITEGVSASLFEAMACNCYPIVSNIPGNQSWITHRENGQLIEIDNIEMLANELIWSFENSEFRNQTIIRNRKFVEENANYDINMKIISEKYHELINYRK